MGPSTAPTRSRAVLRLVRDDRRSAYENKASERETMGKQKNILGTLLALGAVLGAGLTALPARATLPELPVEDLGPMAYGANVQLGPLAPDPAGTGFVQLLFVFPGDS